MNKIFITLACALTLASCWNEPTPEPSADGGNMQYTLPQGDHDYDTRIVNLFERTGSAMLYKFNRGDLFFTGDVPTLEGKIVPRPGYEDDPILLKRDSVVAPAVTSYMLLSEVDESYIGKQLDLIEELCLDFYTDEQLSKLLPPTIYLAGSWALVDKSVFYLPNGTHTDGSSLASVPAITKLSCYAGVGSVTFSWGDADIDAMTADQRLRFKKNVNYVLIKQATDKGAFTRAEEFGAISTYTSTAYGYALAARNTNGILGMNFPTGNISNRNADQIVPLNYNSTPTPQIVDWDSYIAWIVSTTEAQREDPSHAQGFLASTKDTTGKIRQKYNIVVKHMLDNYGIDLVKIGNTPVE